MNFHKTFDMIRFRSLDHPLHLVHDAWVCALHTYAY